LIIPDSNFSIPDPGSRVKKIPDPGFDSHKRIKVFLTQKMVLSSWKYDPGCSSRIRILIFLPSRIQGSKRQRIPDPLHRIYPRELNTDPKSPLMCCLGAGKPVAATAARRHLEFGGTAAATTDQSARRVWIAGFHGRLCPVLQAGHWEKRRYRVL
jgi:hypothetical protein